MTDSRSTATSRRPAMKDMKAVSFVVGQRVRTWFDTGGGKGQGPQILYGVAESVGPKTALIRWESGLTNRVHHCDYRVTVCTEKE